MGLIIQNNQPGNLGNYVVMRPGKVVVHTAEHSAAGIISYRDKAAEHVAFELKLGAVPTAEAVITALYLQNNEELSAEITERWEEIVAGHA